MVSTLVALMIATAINVKPIQSTEVVATVSTCYGNTVAVEIREADGSIGIYEFYGDGFVPNEDITLIMVGDKIIGVKGDR